MSRSVFGWSYPPGAANDPNAPWNQQAGPCEVCGLEVEDDCICQECPVCGAHGDPKCYREHGLVRTEEQKASYKKAEKQWLADAEAYDAYWSQYYEENKNE
jgi:hypothetical protein